MFGKKKEPSIIALMTDELRTSKQNYLHHMEKLEKELAAVNMYAARIKRLNNAIRLETEDDIQTVASSYLGKGLEAEISAFRESEARRDPMSNQGRSCGQQESQANSQSSHSAAARSSTLRGVGRGIDSGGTEWPLGIQPDQLRGNEPGWRT